MKEHENSLEEEINEAEVRNVFEIEFRVMIVNMLNNMNKDIVTMRK